jgi:hypothetical protein
MLRRIAVALNQRLETIRPGHSEAPRVNGRAAIARRIDPMRSTRWSGRSMPR